MKRAWIKQTAFDSMTVEANRMFPNETGGVLVGFQASNGELVIHNAVGPGPLATHQKKRFHPDHAWQCAELDVLYAKSNHDLIYLGDWHTHPNGVALLSWLDRRTLRSIARHPQAFAPTPIMMIGGGGRGGWDWKMHLYGKDKLCGLVIYTDLLDFVIFE